MVGEEIVTNGPGGLALRKERKPFSKFAYQSRVKSVLNSAAAQKVAVNYAKRLRKTCKEVVKRKGAAGDA